MVDMVVHRHQLRSTIAELCRLLTNAPARKATGTMPVPVEAPVRAPANSAPAAAAPPVAP
jgi:acetyl-CoA carboxylase carboxyl transferase subunit beta